MQEKPILNVCNVFKHYQQVTAVDNLSFSVKEGEIFALLGPNGAGKSSLVRMLIGFTHPDSGTITVNLDARSYSAIPHHALGYLPEDRGLYSEKTLTQNLMYFARLRGVDKQIAKQRIDFWLNEFELIERQHDPLKSLSKGNQQKVQLISAVLHEPKLVLLDEPFSGLDPINQEKVVTFLAKLKQRGITVILSAHQMAMVEKLADRMLLMNQGQTVLLGSLAEIKQQIGVSAELVLRYETDINLNTLDADSSRLTLLNNNTIRIELSDAKHLNTKLIELTQLGTLQHIESKTMDLHQLYLKAIAQHPTQEQRQHGA
ncbi:Vitamin B12 import ATP-binding protein BtuD [Pseudoalteromonas holothuriae]|uniref:Vitamin B12 import ATP-binding protein BtuD n=1 Tax=Pseudoalteromonas holothuriae TaxID=2963714 RepID=A0A9W4R324_9GAMM|nr:MULTISPECIES: ATP-binding cassette domain-containing protein [unclassified Pseudoalteromonas]CAH9063781.1 Vitamin B12 import ATP-binding protein BtuD [Pseudoalteromonas sp. CIP111951]CAH9064877.1 Vitamin B12 import ATP-binding protein BtuD [Pseudoalteromonas sp. CIP111854]